MKKIILTVTMLATLTGCVNNTDSELSSEAGYVENVTGGKQVKQIKEDDLVVIDTDGDNILDSSKDETDDTLDNTGFEYNVKVFDTDGDGKISNEDGTKERVTTVINLKNISGNDIKIKDFKIHLESSDVDENINIEYMDTGEIDKSNLILGEKNFENTIKYVDDKQNNEFSFPKDNQVTIVLTSNAIETKNDVVPATLSFVALNDDGASESDNVNYYVQSTPVFAGE